MGKSLFTLVVGALLLQLGSLQSRAAITTLSNNNSVAMVDPTSQAGMMYWAVQGQSQLNQQWFWYRVGNNPEQSINTIGAPTLTMNGTRGLTALYTSPGQFSVQIDYLLTGGATVAVGQNAVSDMAETITLNNLSGNPLDFHFFQYSDFNLGGGASDTVQLGKNLFNLYNEAVQYKTGIGLTETVTAPGANHGEVGLVGATLGKLNNGTADNLNDIAGPLTGDVTWALQWDVTLNGSYIISKDKNLNVVIQPVPEPSTMAIVGLGLAGMAVRGLRKRRA